MTKLIKPKEGRVLLHSCCAPCSGAIMEKMLDAEIEFSVFYYNPNIHPQKEYLIRKEENKKFADKFGINFIDADYDPQNWLEKVKGFENGPERGRRCTLCFDMRLVRTALYAQENNFPLFATSLGISRWKNLEQVNGAGLRAAALFANVEFWDCNWRKGGANQRGLEISKKERFYQQEYCGCIFSLRDANKWRKEQGREEIKIGIKHYGDN